MISSICNRMIWAACNTNRTVMGHPEFCLLFPSIYNSQQCRGRKRNLKRALTKQERQERRLKREAKEAERKKYTFMQRIQISRMKHMVSISEQFPGRFNPAKEAHLPDKPTTNIFIRSAYKTQYYSVSEALQMHREMQQPSIYNNPNARIRLRMELNMTTEKKTKMVVDSEELVPIPHPFKHNEKRTILAFAYEQHNRDAAIEAGAEIALGPDMIKKIIKGMFRIDDYDFCVAHVDMASSILPLRGILRSRFPNKINAATYTPVTGVGAFMLYVCHGGLGDNFQEIISKFKNGVKLTIRGDPIMPIWGLCDTVIGRLTMDDEELEANIAAVIGALCKHRNPALGPFINRALLMVIPGDAHFALNISPFLPIPTEQEIEKIEKRMKKKKESVSAKAESPEVSSSTVTA